MIEVIDVALEKSTGAKTSENNMRERVYLVTYLLPPTVEPPNGKPRQELPLCSAVAHTQTVHALDSGANQSMSS
jgi:hypothetical protein